MELLVNSLVQQIISEQIVYAGAGNLRLWSSKRPFSSSKLSLSRFEKNSNLNVAYVLMNSHEK